MAITSYATLQSTALSWAHRPDLTTEVLDAIAFAEHRLFDKLLLKNMESDEALTLTTDVNYVALPSGFISPIAFWLVVDTFRVPLTPVLPQQLEYSPTSAQPEFWAIDGANIRFDCPAYEGYSAYLRCIKSSALSGSNTTNYLLTRRPDVYLAGTIAELARYMKNDSLFAIWEPRFIAGMKELAAAENRARGMVGLRTDIGASRRPNILTGD